MSVRQRIRGGWRKASLLAPLLLKSPVEVYDRVLSRIQTQLEQSPSEFPLYDAQELGDALRLVNRATGLDLEVFLNESHCSHVMLHVVRHSDVSRGRQLPFSVAHNADPSLARLCYAAVRALKPDTVLETGVAYGVTSAFILKALEVNGGGVLHSVDLPPLAHEADRYVGMLIPEALRSCWHLHRGTSKRILPSVLPQLGQVGVFVHDSLHTYRNMYREFDMVTPYLTRPGLMISDDIGGNLAFRHWAERNKPDLHVVIKEAEKNSLCGLAIIL